MTSEPGTIATQHKKKSLLGSSIASMPVGQFPRDGTTDTTLPVALGEKQDRSLGVSLPTSSKQESTARLLTAVGTTGLFSVGSPPENAVTTRTPSNKPSKRSTGNDAHALTEPSPSTSSIERWRGCWRLAAPCDADVLDCGCEEDDACRGGVRLAGFEGKSLRS